MPIIGGSRKDSEDNACIKMCDSKHLKINTVET